jgi:hypothetical protein
MVGNAHPTWLARPERMVDFCSCKLDMLAIYGAQIASAVFPDRFRAKQGLFR